MPEGNHVRSPSSKGRCSVVSSTNKNFRQAARTTRGKENVSIFYEAFFMRPVSSHVLDRVRLEGSFERKSRHIGVVYSCARGCGVAGVTPGPRGSIKRRNRRSRHTKRIISGNNSWPRTIWGDWRVLPDGRVSLDSPGVPTPSITVGARRSARHHEKKELPIKLNRSAKSPSRNRSRYHP